MIYISTYHNDINYGAALQVCALQRFLKNNGYDSEIINIQHNVEKIYGNTIKGFLNKTSDAIHTRQIKVGRDKFKEFCIENHRLTKTYDSFEDLKLNPPEGSVYISGSDQVFNPLAEHPEFFLQFGKDTTRRISYAASIGVSNVPKEKQAEFRKSLSAFDCISLREGESVEEVSKFYDRDIRINIDPTLLLDKSEWKDYQKEYEDRKQKRQYILVYMLYRPKWLSAKLIEISRLYNMDIIALSYGGILPFYRKRTIYDAGPAEFLDLIENAAMVISSSYHGCIFSSIYKKPFYAVVNPNAPLRINSFLNLFKLQNRVLLSNTELNFDVDYRYMEKQIQTEREKSKKYLIDVIEGKIL